ncbi:DUF2071 domain-containing protein [Kitasatospora terrestris]|uniref:DUF2071 domain-containing protein n=1 Tax=Kitasatospora terrestris TaxID=258051 RepID=UPI003CD06FEF
MSALAESRFEETKLHAYVRELGGRDGLWFFSLHATDPFVVLAADALGSGSTNRRPTSSTPAARPPTGCAWRRVSARCRPT